MGPRRRKGAERAPPETGARASGGEAFGDGWPRLVHGLPVCLVESIQSRRPAERVGDVVGELCSSRPLHDLTEALGTGHLRPQLCQEPKRSSGAVRAPAVPCTSECAEICMEDTVSPTAKILKRIHVGVATATGWPGPRPLPVGDRRTSMAQPDSWSCKTRGTAVAPHDSKQPV